jgi:hypothetical protein
MNLLKDSESNAVVGLGTSQHTTANAGLYEVDVRSTIVPPSGLSIVINLNGSPISTSAAPTINDVFAGCHAEFNCAIGDVITVVLSSSSVQDIVGLQNVKSVISVIRL